MEIQYSMLMKMGLFKETNRNLRRDNVYVKREIKYVHICISKVVF